MLPETYKEDIRVLLGFDPDDERDVPNTLIDGSRTVVEAEIKQRVSDWDELDDVDIVFLRRGLEFAICADLCEPLKTRLPSREKSPFYEHNSAVNWDRRKKEFEAKRDMYIAKISTQKPLNVRIFHLARR